MTIEISNLSWFAILAIAIVAVTLIVMQIIRLRGRKAFESLTSTLAAKADDANGGYIYSLDGRRVQNPSKGVYIVNGKKLILK